MIQFIVANALEVCSISTIAKRLESKDSIFAPYALAFGLMYVITGVGNTFQSLL